jgi:hypothetical protein
VFGLTQVFIDLEPAFYLVRGETDLHRFFHTYVGASVIAAFSMVVGRPVCQWFLRVWNSRLDEYQSVWFSIQPRISWKAASIAALTGAYSHVFLDSIMHADLQPLSPWSAENRWLSIVTINWLHWFCVITGFLGLVLLSIVQWVKRRREYKGSRLGF